MSAGDVTARDSSNTGNDPEMKKEAEDRKLHRMAKVHDFLEMWQGWQILRATQKESHYQNKTMTAVGYTSDTKEIVKASWSLFQHHGAAACKLSGRSPLPPALSAQDLPGGQTQISNVCQIRRIGWHPVITHEDSSPESFSGNKNRLNWNSDLDNPNYCGDDCAADEGYENERDNGIEDGEIPELRHVCAAPNIPWLIRPTQKSRIQAENVLVTVTTTETRRNEGMKKNSNRMCRYFSPESKCSLTESFIHRYTIGK